MCAAAESVTGVTSRLVELNLKPDESVLAIQNVAGKVWVVTSSHRLIKDCTNGGVAASLGLNFAGVICTAQQCAHDHSLPDLPPKCTMAAIAPDRSIAYNVCVKSSNESHQNHLLVRNGQDPVLVCLEAIPGYATSVKYILGGAFNYCDDNVDPVCYRLENTTLTFCSSGLSRREELEKWGRFVNVFSIREQHTAVCQKERYASDADSGWSPEVWIVVHAQDGSSSKFQLQIPDGEEVWGVNYCAAFDPEHLYWVIGDDQDRWIAMSDLQGNSWENIFPFERGNVCEGKEGWGYDYPFQIYFGTDRKLFVTQVQGEELAYPWTACIDTTNATRLWRVNHGMDCPVPLGKDSCVSIADNKDGIVIWDVGLIAC